MADNGKERIGDYEIVELVGDGAQGKVFRARCLAAGPAGEPAGRIVALKVLRFSGEDEKKVARFHQQAVTLCKLNHPGLVRYLDSFSWHTGEWDEAHCMVMEYLEGETLQDRIAASPGGLPWPEVKRIFEACLDALVYAREQGVIHRDLKPSNIFLGRDGSAKLIDFDIARRDDSSQNSTAGWKGTFDYMAPDFVVVPGFRGDEPSDIFSLGVVFYEALTGTLPFEKLSEGAHIGYLNRWRDPGKVEPSFQPPIFRVLVNARSFAARCIAPLREKRCPTFAEMRAGLGALSYRTLAHRGGETYELTGLMGAGGFGEVFQGRRASDGLAVAVKRLFATEYSARFLKEARILQKYPHPAIVRYVDFVEVELVGGERQYFIVMEQLEGMPGSSLRARIREGAPLPLREALTLFTRYLSALAFLHDNPRPIIHRDLKPSNLYAPPGRPGQGRIFDLGVARDVAGTATAGGVPGTLDYMAPEFSRPGNERGSPQSDLYSLGLCLHEALTGRTVFQRLPSEMSTAWARFKGRAEKPPELLADAPAFAACPGLFDLLRRLLDPDPRRRPAHASEVRQRIEELLAALPAEEEGAAEPTQSTAAEAVWTRPADELSDAEPEATQATLAMSRTAAVAALAAAGGGQPPPDAPTQAPGPDLDGIDWSAVRRRDTARQRLGLGLAAAAVVSLLAGGAWLYLHNKEKEKAPARDVATVPVTVPPVVPAPVPTPVTAPPAPAPTPPPPPPTSAAPVIVAAPVEVALPAPSPDPAYLGRLQAAARAARAAGATGQLARIEAQGRLAPDLFDAAVRGALASNDIAGAERIAAGWSGAAGELALMGLKPAQHAERLESLQAAIGLHALDRAAAAIEAVIPKEAAGDVEALAAEKAAEKLAEAARRDWPHVTIAARDRRLEPVTSKLRKCASGFFQALEKRAQDDVAGGGDPAGMVKLIEGWRTRLPRLVELARADVDRALAGASKAGEGRRAFQAEVDAVLAAVPANLTTAAEVAAAEAAAVKLAALPSRTWPGVTDAQRKDQLDKTRAALAGRMSGMVQRIREDALRRIQAGQDAQASRAGLVDLAQRAPAALALAPGAADEAIRAIDAELAKRKPAVAMVKPPPPPAVTNAPAPAAAGALDPGELAALKAIEAGAPEFKFIGLTRVNAAAVRDLLALLAALKQDFDTPGLMISPKPARDFLAAAGDAWGSAQAFPGDFGPRAREAAWKMMHGRLVEIAGSTVGGTVLMRSPSQQAKIRREFLRLLGGMEDLTGRLAACPVDDPLRKAVQIYFGPEFFSPQLLASSTPEDAAMEARIPWLAAEFAKARDGK